MTAAEPINGLVAKWKLIGALLNDPKHSSADHAVLWQICERYNAGAGAAWPSLERIAQDTGRSRRTVQDSVKRLQKFGFIEVIPGSRTRSNRYKPRFEVGNSTAIPVGKPTSEGKEADCLDVGKPTAMESSYQPGQEAGGIRGPAVPAGGAAGALPPALGPPAVLGRADQKKPIVAIGRKYEGFWNAYPPSNGRRTGPVEDHIDLLLEQGVDLGAIIAGATAYDAQLKAKPGHDLKYTRHPLNWLKDRGWQDEYPVSPPAVPPVKSVKRRNKIASKKEEKSKPSNIAVNLRKPERRPRYFSFDAHLERAAPLKSGPLVVGDRVKVFLKDKERLVPTPYVGRIIEERDKEFLVYLDKNDFQRWRTVGIDK